MILKPTILFVTTFLLVAIIVVSFTDKPNNDDDFIAYKINPAKTILKFYWKDDNGNPLKSLKALKDYCASKKEKLLFGMNGGMYKEGNSPLGLFIQQGKTASPINKKNGSGNFYLQPNGILFITNDKFAHICTTGQFPGSRNIEYATQSGPMLLVDGKINSNFKKGSVNINIRNGVGLLPGNTLLFAMSKNEISLYDFADYFKQAGCTNALYLDGFVSRTYLPEKNWTQLDGNFGVLIGSIVKE
jgi:uncharacterized protein YigE (DUF2233 family)